MEQLGIQHENRLRDLLALPLLADFVHCRPYFFQPRRQRKEVCDLLIEDGLAAMVVQLKTQDQTKASVGRDEQSWALKELHKASRLSPRGIADPAGILSPPALTERQMGAFF